MSLTIAHVYEAILTRDRQRKIFLDVSKLSNVAGKERSILCMAILIRANDRHAELRLQHMSLSSRENTIQARETMLLSREAAIAEREARIMERENRLAAKEKWAAELHEREKFIHEREKIVHEREQRLERLLREHEDKMDIETFKGRDCISPSRQH